MRTKKDIQILLKSGLSPSLLSKLNESQLRVLSEKFFKEKNKEVKINNSELKDKIKDFIKTHSHITNIKKNIDEWSDEQLVNKIKDYSKDINKYSSIYNKKANELFKELDKDSKGKKEETKEETEVVTQLYDSKNPDDVKKLNQVLQNPTSLQGKNVQVKETEMTEDVSVDVDNATAGKITQSAHQVQAPDGMGDLGDATIDKEEDLATEGVIKEKFESKSQQRFFWAKCNTSKGFKKKKWCVLAR
jgi:hypothetical protein